MSDSQRKILVIGAGAAMVAAAPLLTSGAAQAASFEVTNLNDSGPGSLRQAIIDSNALAGADVITFQAGLTGTIVLSTGQLNVSDSVTVTGPGAASLTIDANDTSRVFYLYNSSALLDVVISGLTLTGGSAQTGGAIVDFDENLTLDSVVLDGNASVLKGGALWADGFNMTLTIRDSVISGNSSGSDGGGVYVEDTGGPLTIQRTTISGNTAIGSGGGIYFYDPDDNVTIVASTISGNTATDTGGGIYLYNMDTGVFTIDSSTISGNTATNDGGGIYFYDIGLPTLIVNSTISGNHSVSGDGGGLALYGSSVDMLTISHSTIAGNDAGGAGGNLSLGGDTELFHTVVADGVAPSAADIAIGLALDANFSLIEDATGLTLNGTGNITGTDPVLGALANNGGTTETQWPGAGSALVDAGDPAVASPPLTDQRGFARIVGAAIDIGAVERGLPPVNDVGATPEDTPLNVAAPGVLGNDAGATSAVLVTGPSSGVVVLNADGSYLYTPNANFNGTDSFTYEAFFGAGSLGQATVTITVTPVNDSPIAVNDAAIVTVGGTVTIQVLGNDSDPDGDVLTISAVTQGSKGTVTIVGTTVVYRPNLTATGVDSFTYTVSDGVNTATATVTVTLIPGRIPDTGSEHGSELMLAAGLVIAGGALTAGTRRRRSIAP